jgi:hypothetical protein
VLTGGPTGRALEQNRVSRNTARQIFPTNVDKGTKQFNIERWSFPLMLLEQLGINRHKYEPYINFADYIQKLTPN